MTTLRWLFVDPASGRIVVAQTPNLALWINIISQAAGVLLWRGEAGTIVSTIGFASLVVRAADEIARGVNPWRRLLGASVLLWLCSRGALALVRYA